MLVLGVDDARSGGVEREKGSGEAFGDQGDDLPDVRGVEEGQDSLGAEEIRAVPECGHSVGP